MSGFALASFANSGGGGYRRSSSCIDSMACVPDWIVIGPSYGLSLGRVQMAPLRGSQGSTRAQQHQGGEYTMKMPSFKQTILLVGTPAILAVGAVSAMAASSPAPTTTPAPTQQGQSAAEPAETADAAEAATDAAEPATSAAETAAEAAADANLPGGGNADAAGQNVDHQFEGVE